MTFFSRAFSNRTNDACVFQARPPSVSEDRPFRVELAEPVNDLHQLVRDSDHPVFASDPACLVFGRVKSPKAIVKVAFLDLGDLAGSCPGVPHRLEEVAVTVVLPKLQQPLMLVL